MSKVLLLTLVVFGLAQTQNVEAKVYRSSEMTSTQWAGLGKNPLANDIVEFRQGDDLSLSFGAEGDFLETVQTGVSTVSVKQNFWLKLHLNDIEMSLDGTTYKPIHEIVSGVLSASTNTSQAGVPVSAINLILKATAK